MANARLKFTILSRIFRTCTEPVGASSLLWETQSSSSCICIYTNSSPNLQPWKVRTMWQMATCRKIKKSEMYEPHERFQWWLISIIWLLLRNGHLKAVVGMGCLTVFYFALYHCTSLTINKVLIISAYVTLHVNHLNFG